MPDPIGYADLERYRVPYAADVHRRLMQGGLQVGMPRCLPLPNGPGKVRALALLEPRDELVLRLVAGVVLEHTESAIDRSRVFSYRTSKKSGTWNLRDGKGIDWNGLKRKGLSVMRSSEPEVVLQRDVRSYYGSCAADSIHRWMAEELGLPEDLVRWTFDRFARWEAHGFRGLPIGPEFSAVIGTAYLFAVDDVLSAHPAVLHHLRVTDDFYIAIREATRVAEVDEALRSTLATRGLFLNEEKSEELTLEEAFERFNQRQRDYWRARLDAEPETPDDTIVAMLKELASDPLQDFDLSRYVLGAARRGKVTAAIPVVLRVPTLLELCPTMCGDLLTSRPGSSSGFVNEMMAFLEEPYRDRTAARNLHLIRSLPDGELGAPEGRVLRSIALNLRCPIPVRAWALYRACSTPAFTRSERGDIALDGSTDQFLQRAAIVSFSRDDSASRTKILSDSRIRSGPLRYSGQWAQAA